MTTRTAQTRFAPLLVFLAALIVRASFCFVAIPILNLNVGPNRSDFFTSTDGYIDLAINMVDHGTYAFAPDATPTIYRAPLYPVALAVAYAGVGNAATAILIVNCLASSVACAVVFVITRRLFRERVTMLWAAPVVLFPLSIYYCASSFSDTFLTLTIALYLWGLIALMQSPTRKHGAGSGIAFAAAALTKAVVLPIPMLICIFAALRNRKALPQSAIAMIVGFALVGIWTARNHEVTGAFVPVTGGAGFNLLLGNFMIDRGDDCDASLKYARLKAVEHMQTRHDVAIDLSSLDTDGHLDVPRDIDTQYGHAAIAMYQEAPILLARKLAINSARFWYFSSSPTKSLANGIVNLTVLSLALIGLWQVRQADRSTSELIALFVVAFMLLYAAVIVHSSRFSLPIVMVLLPLATSPVASLWHSIVSGPRCDATTTDSKPHQNAVLTRADA